MNLFGHNLIKNKAILYALTSLYGIGFSSSTAICRDLGFLPILKVKELTEIQQYQLAMKIKKEFIVEGSLEEHLKAILQEYLTNGSRRGYRLANGLPVNGQRTHSNGKTARKLSHK